MTVHPVLRLGDPRLWQVAEPMQSFGTTELAALIEDMPSTTDLVNGAGMVKQILWNSGCSPQDQ